MYCNEDLSKIENYDKAIADENQMWHLHHRLETNFSNGQERPIKARITAEELKALDMYYHRPAEELIFMTKSEHMRLHKKFNNWNNGRKFTEEHKKKLSEANKGKLKSESHKRKLSESMKAYYARKKS